MVVAAGYVAPFSLSASMAVQRSQCQVAAPGSCPALSLRATLPGCRQRGCAHLRRQGPGRGSARGPQPAPPAPPVCLHPGSPASLWDRVARGCVQLGRTWGPRGHSSRQTASRGATSFSTVTDRPGCHPGRDELGHWAAAATGLQRPEPLCPVHAGGEGGLEFSSCRTASPAGGTSRRLDGAARRSHRPPHGRRRPGLDPKWIGPRVPPRGLAGPCWRGRPGPARWLPRPAPGTRPPAPGPQGRSPTSHLFGRRGAARGSGRRGAGPHGGRRRRCARTCQQIARLRPP